MVVQLNADVTMTMMMLSQVTLATTQGISY